jgi:putative ABC transport system permease protein
MGTLWQDVRYGVRAMRRSPGLTVVAVVALALGVGANTAIFSVVNGVLLRPLPFPEPDRLVAVEAYSTLRPEDAGSVAYPDFVDWQRDTSGFESTAVYSSASAGLTGDGFDPEQIQGVATTPEFFRTVGVAPARGRAFTAEEAARLGKGGDEDEEKPEGDAQKAEKNAQKAESGGQKAENKTEKAETGAQEEERGGAQVVVLSHGLWQRRFGGDPSILNKTIVMDGAAVQVVGVMPEGFRYPLDAEAVDFWVPFDANNEYAQHRGASFLTAFARLKPGVTVAQAQSEMDALAQRLGEAYPRTNATRRFRITSLHERLVGDVKPALLVLLGAVGFVLLIACANVANLLLARAASRSKEFAIRTALGASRARIVRQLLTESLLLSLAGGVAGLLLALWGVDLLMAVVPADIPRIATVETDGRVLAFTFGVSLLTGVLFGLAPAFQASRADVGESLKDSVKGAGGGGLRSRVRGALVVVEVALSLVLLVGAGLLIRSFESLRAVNPGFDPEGVLTATLTPSDNKYPEEEQQTELFRRAVERASQMPGVEAAGAVFPLPLSGNNIGTNFTIDNASFDSPDDVHSAEMKIISPDFPRAMGVSLVAGRAFTEHDTGDAPPVFVVSETLARKFFGTQTPVGRTMSVRDISGVHTGEIVGVIRDVKYQTLSAASEPAYYVPYTQTSVGEVSLITRARKGVDPAALAPGLRAAVREVDTDQPLADVRPMTALMSDSVSRQRFQMLLLGVFAAAALVLASVGLFGVMSYMVTQRTHEIGVRMALGARAADVLRLIIGRGMLLTLLGVAVGLAGAFALTRLMSDLLYGVSALDPATFVGVTAVVVAVAFLSCFIPARRATKVDPMVALRYE